MNKGTFKNIEPERLLAGIALLILGILFFVFPVNSVKIICYVAGAALIAFGVVKLVLFFAKGMNETGNGLILGGVFVCIGVMLIVKQGLLQDLITMLFGFVLILGGLTYLQKSIGNIRRKNLVWIVYILLAAVFLALGIVVLVNPFSERALGIFIGISLVFEGVCDLTTTICYGVLKGRCAPVAELTEISEKPEPEQEKTVQDEAEKPKTAKKEKTAGTENADNRRKS